MKSKSGEGAPDSASFTNSPRVVFKQISIWEAAVLKAISGPPGTLLERHDELRMEPSHLTSALMALSVAET